MPTEFTACRAYAGARRCRSWARHLLAALFGVSLAHGAAAGEPVPDWGHIGAIFQERCIMCHSEAAAERGLRLDTYDGAIAGSENGPVLVPGDPSSSELIRRLTGASRPRMPFLSYPLTSVEIDLIKRWIGAGLPESIPPTSNAGSD